LAGLTFSPSKMSTLVFIAGLTCLYLFLMYSLDLYSDWSLRRYRRLPAKAEVQALLHHAAQTDAEKRVRLALMFKQTDEIIERRREKMKALHEQFPGIGADTLRRSEELEKHCREDGLDSLQKQSLNLAADTTYYTQVDLVVRMLRATRILDRLRVALELLLPLGLALYAIKSAVSFWISP